MERGQRVTLIKKLAGRLAEQSATDCNLALGQFDLPTAWIGDWDDDTYAYVVAQLSRGTDERLLNLDAFLSPSDEGLKPDISSDPWTAGVRGAAVCCKPGDLAVGVPSLRGKTCKSTQKLRDD